MLGVRVGGLRSRQWLVPPKMTGALYFCHHYRNVRHLIAYFLERSQENAAALQLHEWPNIKLHTRSPSCTYTSEPTMAFEKYLFYRSRMLVCCIFKSLWESSKFKTSIYGSIDRELINKI